MCNNWRFTRDLWNNSDLSCRQVLWASFINQLFVCLCVPSVPFAGNFKILFILLEVNNQQAQSEIDLFCDWCDNVQVLTNINKSCCLHSSRYNGTSYKSYNGHIPDVEFFKDLRVVRSADGAYRQHIDYVTNKAKRIVASVLNSIIITNSKIGWKIFQSDLQPVLSYGSDARNPLLRCYVKMMGKNNVSIIRKLLFTNRYLTISDLVHKVFTSYLTQVLFVWTQTSVWWTGLS